MTVCGGASSPSSRPVSQRTRDIRYLVCPQRRWRTCVLPMDQPRLRQLVSWVTRTHSSVPAAQNATTMDLRFLAQPTLLGVIDSYGIELIHPVRRGRNPGFFGASGISNHRWIVGAKWCVALNHLGQIIGWV